MKIIYCTNGNDIDLLRASITSLRESNENEVIVYCDSSVVIDLSEYNDTSVSYIEFDNTVPISSMKLKALDTAHSVGEDDVCYVDTDCVFNGSIHELSEFGHNMYLTPHLSPSTVPKYCTGVIRARLQSMYIDNKIDSLFEDYKKYSEEHASISNEEDFVNLRLKFKEIDAAIWNFVPVSQMHMFFKILHFSGVYKPHKSTILYRRYFDIILKYLPDGPYRDSVLKNLKNAR